LLLNSGGVEPTTSRLPCKGDRPSYGALTSGAQLVGSKSETAGAISGTLSLTPTCRPTLSGTGLGAGPRSFPESAQKGWPVRRSRGPTRAQSCPGTFLEGCGVVPPCGQATPGRGVLLQGYVDRHLPPRVLLFQRPLLFQGPPLRLSA